MGRWPRSPSLWLCSEDISSYSQRGAWLRDSQWHFWSILRTPRLASQSWTQGRQSSPTPPAIAQLSEPLYHFVMSLKPATLCTEEPLPHNNRSLTQSSLGPHLLG